ncbi:hypothetical protein ACWEPL_12405 [Nonomuraea sp. NPDC004186]
MSDILAHLQGLTQHLPEPPRVARMDVGQSMFNWLKATAQPEGAPSEDAWRPVGWTPPPLAGAMFGVPVVLRGDLAPGAWRVIDRDGEIMKEGTL